MFDWLCAKNETQIQPVRNADLRGIGRLVVFDDDRYRVRMLALQVGEQALGTVAAATVLPRAISSEVDGEHRLVP